MDGSIKFFIITMNYFLFGDSHEGAAARYDRGWEKLINTMESEYEGLGPERNYGTDHGDAIEAIMIDDRRYDPLVTKESFVLEQIHNAARQRSAIRGRLLCMLIGNHEFKLHKFGNLTLEILRQLYGEYAEDRYGTFSCKVCFYDFDGKPMFKHFATHGRKSVGSVADDPERQMANMKIQLKRHLYRKAGDCVVMSKGHTHKLLKREPNQELYITDNGKRTEQNYLKPNHERNGYIHPETRWYLNTGSFLRTYVQDAVTYSEFAEYDPVELGYYVVMVRDGEVVGVKKELI